MPRNYGLRYPYDENPKHDETNNYGAWIPTAPVETFIESPGQGHREFIPKDYVPKNQRKIK